MSFQLLAVSLALSLPGMADATAFESPQHAVPALAKMLAAEDWMALARAYALEGTGVERRELESGRYFTRPIPTVSHPAGLARWRHPFPPGYRYLSHTTTGDEVLVQVGIEIDQGDGMVQRGLREFRMRKTATGWQVLPDATDILVRRWIAAALRAHVSRARATLESPKAEAEANRIEALLRADPHAPLALADFAAELEAQRTETATHFTSIMTAAREQTDQDRRELARLEQEIQRLDMERALLGALRVRIR